MSMCSDAGQAMIEDDIRRLGLQRVVIGACSPFLHEQTFRGTLERAGLNPYCYQHVGLREQDSWATHSDRAGATAKAIRLMKAGVAKARFLEPLESVRLEAARHALIIGGGTAGLRAAWDMVRRGLQVTLIEKTPFLGGRVAQLGKIFPTDEDARRGLAQLIQQVARHPNVTLLTSTQLVGLSGCVGDFHATLRQQPRGIPAGFAAVEAALRACPADVPDEFNFGSTRRKAVYLRDPGCFPAEPAIDWSYCTLCGACRQVPGGEAIQLDPTPTTVELKVGAIVVATGFAPYEPSLGEFGYGQVPEVITLPQFIRLLAQTEGAAPLQWNGHSIRAIAWIHCVGSRQVEGVHSPQPDGRLQPYCSRVCCTATMQAAREVQRRFPAIDLYDLHQDVRTYGRGHEDLYRQAGEHGMRFLRFVAEEGPVVTALGSDGDHAVLVSVKDTLTRNKTLELPVDLVVLAVGMLPSAIQELYPWLKVTPGNDRFLLEVHPKLRPVETAVKGIVLAGTAQSPMNIQESLATAGAAAAKVAGLLSGGQVELEPFVARVDLDRCRGDGACLQACQYEGALRLETGPGEGGRFAVVSAANCVGCGVCVGACPNQAIDVQGWTLDQYRAMVAAIAEDITEPGGVR
jgi:heterodisulfide reductase subunit A